MPKRRLLWHLVPAYAVLALLTALVVGWFASYRVEQLGLSDARAELAAAADLLDHQLGPEIDEDRTGFERLCRLYLESRELRVALLAPNAKVDFDNRRRPEEFENLTNRPEFRRALDGTADTEIRFNRALDARVMYAAAPVVRHDRLAAVLYLSRPLAELDEALGKWRWQAFVLAAVAAGLAIPLAAATAQRIAVPLEQLRWAAEALTGGKWTARVTTPDTAELATLAETFNRMADTIAGRIGQLIQNNNEQKAVLASMAEGVLAVDGQERVISANNACARLLGVDSTAIQGRRLQEVVRNADLTRFISRALAEPDPIEADVLLHGDRQRVMQAQGAALHDLEGRAIGAVVVLNDVTDFRRLEHIRRDFVANVSHELKTPITSIKGFVETMLDGAMNSPADSERFLRIVAKQADRLHAIIEDLLSLSKIEQSEDADNISLEPAGLRGVLESAVNTCDTIGRDRNITVTLSCEQDLKARFNPMLLEQAVVNLLDNAIKYSEPGREVRLSAAPENAEVAIVVADRGCGIAAEHVPRVFERFYRVDRARSRKLGGTGLGLAIVKHIVQAHHGRISVDSTLGVGTTFTIHLPRA
jgi:two-component system, OmpR family, phosphate regulon sensor histidine kinase PhoR